VKKLRAGKEKKEMPENCLGAMETAGLKKRKFVGRWNLANSIRSEIT